MWFSFTITAPVGRELQVDRVLTILAMSMKYSFQFGRFLDITKHNPQFERIPKVRLTAAPTNPGWGNDVNLRVLLSIVATYVIPACP
jgi:hypothetical protein